MTKTDTEFRELTLNEAHSYAAFSHGRVLERPFEVSLICEELQDDRFNRAYILDAAFLNAESLREISDDYHSLGLPFSISIFPPVSNDTRELLQKNNFEVTDNEASIMVLTDSPPKLEGNPEIRIERLPHDLIETFVTILIRSFSPPPTLNDEIRYKFRRATDILLKPFRKPSNGTPSVRHSFCSTIPSALEHEGVILYIAHLDSIPVGVLYLFSEDGVGGIYHVGVTPEGRRRRVATTLVLQAIENSRKIGNSTLCLQADADSFQERLYTQLGFETIARRSRARRTSR